MSRKCFLFFFALREDRKKERKMDVADILGLSRPVQDEITKLLDDSITSKQKTSSQINQNKGKNKPKGMSRELFALMGSDGIAPSIQTNNVQGSLFKDKRQSHMRGKWIWSTFKNSARR